MAGPKRAFLSPAQSLGLAALVLPALSVFAPKGSTPLFVLACALVLLSREGRAAARNGFAGPLAWALAGLMAWALASLAWTIEPVSALQLWLRVAALLAAALALASAASRLRDPSVLQWALPAGLALGLALAAIEIFADNPLRLAVIGPREDAALWIGHWLNRGMTAIALLAWPAAAALWPRSRPLALALLAACALVLLAGPQRAARLAFLLALPLGALAWWLGPRLRAPLAIGALVLLLAAPLVPSLLPPAAELQASGAAVSISHRTQIWAFAVDRIVERPLLGWGFDSSRAIPGGQEAAAGTVGRLMPLHPHNAALQAWLELGLPGALAFGAALAAAFAAALGLATPPARAAATALVGAAATIGLVSFGVWQTQWLAALALAAAFMAGIGGLTRPGSRHAPAGARSPGG